MRRVDVQPLNFNLAPMAASGAAASAEAPPFLLTDLNDDELEVIAGALAVPFEPHVLVALAST